MTRNKIDSIAIILFFCLKAKLLVCQVC